METFDDGDASIEDTVPIFLCAAQLGIPLLLKKTAKALDCMLGGVGIPSIMKDTKDDEGRGAIHYAADGGKVNILRYLIEEIKIDVDIKDGDGQTPLSCAAVEGHLAAVEYLLQMGANPEIPDDTNTTALHHVAMNGHNDVITLLLSKGINVDVTDHFGSPLWYAAANGQHETLKVLLDHGANPNLFFQGSYTPLHASISSQSWQCVEHLLKSGADPNGGPDGQKALLLAAVGGRSGEVIEKLVEAGVDPKEVTNIGRSGVTQIIKLLVEAGADPNVTNIDGLKPVEIAAINGYRRGVEILFPVTHPILSYADWSTNGIMKHANSKEFKEKVTRTVKDNFVEAKSRGTSALQRKKYSLAAYWYSQALDIEPGDASVLSNRSLCYVYLDEGDLAFEDATQCMLLRPDWPEAFYRAGVALKLLNRLDDAADAFLKGLKLDPKNKEIEAAFREVTLDRLEAINVPL